VFLGQYEHSLDQRGRIAIPAKFRDAFQEGLILAQGFDKSILVYPVSEWRRMADKLAALPMTQSNSRRVNRATFSNAFDSELDRQGRVLLPTPLREYAQIKDIAVIVGIYNYLEIWSKELWTTEKALMEQQAWQMAEAVGLKT
jgi:MraZ protein